MNQEPCRYFKKYKAVYAPKCNCLPCYMKFKNKSLKLQNLKETWIHR